MSKVTINMNDFVKVKLTPFGMNILKMQHEELQLYYPYSNFHIELDKDGYYTSQLWSLFGIFGKYIGNRTEIPFENNIVII